MFFYLMSFQFSLTKFCFQIRRMYENIQIRSSNALLFVVTNVYSPKSFVVAVFFPLVIIYSGSFSQMKQTDNAGSKM